MHNWHMCRGSDTGKPEGRIEGQYDARVKVRARISDGFRIRSRVRIGRVGVGWGVGVRVRRGGSNSMVGQIAIFSHCQP